MKQKLDIYLYEDTIKILERESYRVGLSVSRLIESAIEYKYVKLYPEIKKKEVKLKCQV